METEANRPTMTSMVLTLTVLLPSAVSHAADKPNILFLFADDQRADTIAAHGNPHITTPNLDKLAAAGFSFRSNYCFGGNSGAVCVPSRAMLMSGKTWFRVDTTSLNGAKLLPEHLQEHGYVTFGTGKWHNGQPSWLRAFQRGKNVFFGGMADHTKVPVQDLGPDGKLTPVRTGEKFSSELFADAAIEFLRSHDGKKPFFAYVAFTAPHDPRMPPVPYREAYYRNLPPLPANFLPQLPFDNGMMNGGRDENLAPWPRTEPLIRGQLAEYYGLITHLDEQIGRILEALKQTGQADNTLIIYAADNGLALGSHGLLGKQSVFEHSMRVPLIVAGPGIPQGKSTRAFSYLLDVFPTLCDAIGIERPADLEGESLRPLWEGAKDRVRDSVFLPYIQIQRAVRDDRWKLICYPKIGHSQLFDLQSDPDERVNLIDRPDNAEHVQRLLKLMRQWQAKVGDKLALPTKNRPPEKVDLTGRQREPDQWQPDWIRKKYFDVSESHSAASPAALRTARAARWTQIAADGKALQSVVISAGASERMKALAAQLAEYLGRIAGARFEVQAGSGAQGIVVGCAEHFPTIKTGVQFDPSKAMRREEYLLRSHEKGLWLFGATEMAVEHAVWDLLYRLGYRQFFPGKNWEVVPQEACLRITVDAFERPAYHSRRIWYGFGPWDYAKEPYEDWCVKNRALSGIALNTGHAYDGIVRASRKEFDAHPEYWPLLDGQRRPVGNPKPCLGNPAVRAIFVRHALAHFEKDPSLDSVSMDPSDGGGWCECGQCAKLGTVSDRAITLANEVAAAVNAKFSGKLVGIYGYNYHSPPPNVRVHPKVVVSVATAFIKGGQSLDEIISGWSAKGATLGIREYYSVNTWDRDQPGHARGGNLEYLRRTIPEFYAKGARFMSAESSDNWGPNGLGYYLASRMLWDVREVRRINALVEDFLTRAFGPAKEPMREFYQQLDGSKPHLVVDDQLGRMHRALEKARGLADKPAVRARVDDLVLYAHYCSLYHRYAKSDGAKRQSAFEALIRHAYRMRATMLVHAKAIYRDLAHRDKSVKIPAGAEYSVSEKTNPWKSSEPFSEAEIVGFLKDGIARHQLAELAFQPAKFSMELVPAFAALKFPTTCPVGELGPGRGTQTFYTYVEESPATLEVRITGGLIAHYRDRGHVKVGLWKIGGASQTGEKETLVFSDRSVPPDGVERTVKLAVKETGLFRLTVSDGGDRTQVRWPVGQPMTLLSSQDAPMNDSHGQWMQYFYVPKGTKDVGLFGGGHGEVRDSENRPHFWLNGREPDYYNVPVPPGQGGRIWCVRYGKGAIRLLTVPPCFATTPQGLLLPKEVVDKDASNQ